VNPASASGNGQRPHLGVDYFDGRSTRPQAAMVRVAGSELVIEAGNGSVLRTVPLREIQWPERQRHGPRVAHIESGGSLHCADGTAWDAFARTAGARETWVVRAQQNWRATLVAGVALIALSVAAYLWGLPIAARGIVALVPAKVDRQIGELALSSVEGQWLQPTRLSSAEQQRVRDAFERAVRSAYSPGERPAYELRFHASKIGPNAFAVPGGVIVLTDELHKLVQGRDDVLVGVLAHEIGHVRARHGMRALVQFAVLGTATSVVLGDFSALLAGAPALLGQMAYSRDHEREADAESVKVLRAAGLSPDAMVVFFEKAQQWRRSDEGQRTGGGIDLGIALASHPADAERIAFFRAAAQAR
jgi:Zn-dependent protease with chaperone function